MRDEQCTVGIAVECNTGIGSGFEHSLAQRIEMQRAAIEIDVASIGSIADEVDFRSQALKQLGRYGGRRTICAVDDQMKRQRTVNSGGQVIAIEMIETAVGDERFGH